MNSSTPILCPPPRIALITPVRDEEAFIGGMIESIAAQQIRPARWIIVDDGSSDKTPEIIERHARRYTFIELLRLAPHGVRKPGGENAIAHALNRLGLEQFEFLARFDADLLFTPDYFVRLLEEFYSDPALGIAGGGLYVESACGVRLERAPEYHVRGAVKMYRRECFQQIGGLAPQIGWDTIDEVRAWTKGWSTRSFFQYRVIHRRPTGGGLKLNRIYFERGKAEYYTWSHPLFVLAKALKLTREFKRCDAPACFVAGFCACYLQSLPRLQDRDFVRTRRRQQLGRVATLGASKLPRGDS
ncbi:MAG: glycosyltransferase family 2 protein [Acidobacteriaceae bacterium]|nr:glycosyltransferase family 2 protein [Acidobacteriaceae bacterium]